MMGGMGQLTHDLGQIGRGQTMVDNFATVVANMQAGALPEAPSGVSGLQRDRWRARMHGSIEERDGEVKWRREQLLAAPSFQAAAHAANALLVPGIAQKALGFAKSALAPVVEPIAAGASSLVSGIPKAAKLVVALAAMRQQQEAQSAKADLPPAWQPQAGAPFWLGPQGAT